MSRLVITLFFIITKAAAIFMDGLCPASSSLSTELHGLYSYPVDIFFPEEFKLLKGTSNIVQCTSESTPYNHSCAIDFKKCPITMDSVELATRRARNWTPENSFCELRDYMSSYDEVVNVIVFGGSLTVGHGTEGCHCESSVDGRCKFKKFSPNQEDKEKNMWHITGYCRWSIPLARGLRSMSLAKVRVFNFASSGKESGYSADVALESFRQYNLVPSGRDIILIDHSTNDAMFINDEITAHRALVGVENLIRNLYHLSDPLSPPNIVLLAQYPGMSKERGQPLHDYQAMYAQVAAHYKVPLWSLRDVGYALTLRATAEPATVAAAAGTGAKRNVAAGNISAAATVALRSYVPYLRNDHLNGGVHPAWFVHLYMADLYLSILYSEMSKCFSNPAVLNQPRVTAVNATAGVAVASAKDADDAALDHLLPPRLSNTSIVYCSSKAIYALSVSAEQGGGVPTIGSLLASVAWPLVTESKGKRGWVSELSADATAPPPQLIFEFSLDTMKQHDIWLLDIKHLRTYENAGIASVTLCGQPLVNWPQKWPARFDSLLADPARFHFSDTATYGVQMRMSDFCADSVNKDPERAVRGVGALVFTHERVNCATMGPGEKSRCEARRSTQKVKLEEVTVCAV